MSPQYCPESYFLLPVSSLSLGAAPSPQLLELPMATQAPFLRCHLGTRENSCRLSMLLLQTGPTYRHPPGKHFLISDILGHSIRGEVLGALWGLHSHPWIWFCTLMGPIPSPSWGCRGKSSQRPTFAGLEGGSPGQGSRSSCALTSCV